MFEKVATQVSFRKKKKKCSLFGMKSTPLKNRSKSEKVARNTFFTMGRRLQRGCRTTGTCWPARSKT